jgi:hypothetical protein
MSSAFLMPNTEGSLFLEKDSVPPIKIFVISCRVFFVAFLSSNRSDETEAEIDELNKSKLL